MRWTDLLNAQTEYVYGVTGALIDKVDDATLGWKPADENNWMTVGQLLLHLTEACGMPSRGFVANDWLMPDGTDMREISADEMLLPASKLPTVSSVAEAKEKLAIDKALMLEMIAKAGEDRLENESTMAPWDDMKMPLGMRLQQMIDHQVSHKSQLFYYLKLQGLPVHTGDLWGM